MTFDEWWNNWSVKDWNDIESAKNLFQQAFEAGLHADVHTDNSKVIAELEEKLANADYQLEGRDVTIKELEAQILKMKCCGNCRFSESDKLNGTFCHREGCFVVASAKCKLWEN